METPFTILADLAHTFDRLGIEYVVVGSFASSMHGLYRSTGDIDIVADISSEQIKLLVTALQKSFYVDDQAVRRAVTQKRSFNAIHFESIFKIDIFIPPESDFTRQQLARRRLETISPDISQEIYVATAEDTILAKLYWYRRGDEVSDTQWSDVLGIIGTKGSELDIDYLREHADTLNVIDLLEKVLSETS